MRKISDVSKIFGLSKQKNEFPIKCYVKVCSCRSLGNGAIRKSVQFSRSVVSYCKPMDCSMPDFLSVTNSQRLLKLMSVESVMPSNCLILCHPLLLLPPNFPSIKVFSSESVLRIRWPKYWSFTFSISPSNEYSGLISLRMDCLDLLVVQGTQRVFSNATVQKHQFFGAHEF